MTQEVTDLTQAQEIIGANVPLVTPWEHMPEAGFHKVILTDIAHLPGKKSSTSEKPANESY